MEIEDCSEILKHFQRDINCLLEDDRNLKKKGLTSIMNDLFKPDIKPLLIIEVFQKHILKYLVKLFDDKIEKHREYLLIILEKFLDLIIKNKNLADKDSLETIVKGLLQRISQIPYNEPSEEIRLKILQLLLKIVGEFSEVFTPLISEYSFAMVKILSDTCPDCKKEASHLIVVSSEKLKKYIGFHCTGIFKSLAINANHQHSKVRKATIEAISSLLLAEGAGPSFELIYSSLKQLVSDKINEVRKTTLESIAKIINGFSLSNLKDSEAKLVYLLISGLTDENEDLVNITSKLIEDVGIKRKLLAIEFGES